MAPASDAVELKLFDATHCYYSLCVPARMVEADPRLAVVAAHLRGILQSATRGAVHVTPERVIRSLFLLIDLDHRPPTLPHASGRTAAAAVAVPPTATPAPAWALQIQGGDILISGKDAVCVALAVARLLTEAGFRVVDGQARLDRGTSPAAADGVVIWRGTDQVELAPKPEPAWLPLLLPGAGSPGDG